MACVVGTLALAAAGCGVQEHVNDPRPQAPTRLSVTVSDDAVTVQPTSIGLGPDRYQQIPQNQNSEQPPIRTDKPLTVVVVAANLTDTDSRIEIRGPQDAGSGPLFANSTVTMQTDLPTGAYTIRATDIPGAKPARLAVGPYRSSSQNDVLLP